MNSKKCSKCGEVKILSLFYSDKRGLYGVTCLCKKCSKEKSRMYYKENKEKRRKQNRKWYKENKEKKNKRRKEYFAENKEKIYKQRKEYREKNKEKMRRYYAIQHQKHKEKRSQYEIKKIECLHDAYVCATLGLKRAECPQELIEAKRAQLKLYRACK